jgi:hypothetical protein
MQEEIVSGAEKEPAASDAAAYITVKQTTNAPAAANMPSAKHLLVTPCET